MGEVWEAEQLSLERRVALKFLQPQWALSPSAIEKFNREARAGGLLTHPGTVQTYGAFEADGLHFIVQELVPGRRTLASMLEELRSARELPDDYYRDTALLFAELADTLQHAHERRVIHRDLKPSNILITESGEPRVADFGIARIQDETGLTRTDAVVGTPRYMSPEQASPKVEEVDHRSDVFSLGATLYEALTLTRAFDGDYPQVMRKILTEDPSDPQEIRSLVPRDLAVICMKALEKERARRYTSMAEMAADLRRYLASEPILAKPPTKVERLLKWARRNPTKSVALGLVAGAFVTISTLGYRLARSNSALGQKTAEAEQRTADVLSLSLAQDYEDLVAEAEALWPPHPDLIPAYQAWIARAEASVARIDSLVETRDNVRAEALPLTPAQVRADRERHPDFPELARVVAELEAEPGEDAGKVAGLRARRDELEARIGMRRTWLFTDEVERETRARWWHNQLTRLIGELESLTDPATGLLAETGIHGERGWSVPRRLAAAQELQAAFGPGGRFAERWSRTLPSISAAYPGLRLEVQMGLVPIGADPESGLWEFWLVPSGLEPTRGDDGRLLVEEETGLVLVLLPGGSFWMGAQKGDPDGRNYDPEAHENEGPVHEVELSPFFLSKYEMTQEQWQRVTGANPSRWTEETLFWSIEGEHSAHPVEQVSWQDCMATLPKLGLTLPTEAQWEYACRAGTNTPRPFAFEAFAQYANVADQSFHREFAPLFTAEPWDDGLVGHAPVGRLQPNGFGLHDVLGNVWEWCLDGYAGSRYAAERQKDPVVSPAGSRTRVRRGGNFHFPAVRARSARRYGNTPSSAGNSLGVRPARAIVP